MPACDDRDPVPCKTMAEIDAEETPREKLDDANDGKAGAWFRWIGGAVALAMIVGGIIRACW